VANSADSNISSKVTEASVAEAEAQEEEEEVADAHAEIIKYFLIFFDIF
jgi:sulfur relay (sulfurtransferase) DsrC/TusE family protein